MRINQKKFDELSQLDRIEFRQREYTIIKNDTSIFAWICLAILISVAFCLIIDIWTIVNMRESLGSFNVFFCIACVVMLVGSLMVDIVSIRLRNKQLKELEEKFFEIKVKGKKK